MDIPQLKLLAERVRALLQQTNHPVGHNQSLDLIAALPGLRNWPEVQAFPDRVTACELDLTSAGRLSYRLNKKFDLASTPTELLTVLAPVGEQRAVPALQIWPAGPAAGVYITTSQKAIDALLAHYEEATDGAVVYAERAGSHNETSIDLGEYGLWSSGLARVPSGTLIVIGPLELDQQSWDNSASRLEMACTHALLSGHRVAVLLDSPTPESLREDVMLMVRTRHEGSDYDATALKGLVTDAGELQQIEPFARPRRQPAAIRSVATVDAIPEAALAHLQKALADRRSGLLVFGSGIIDEHSAIEFVASGLAMTEHVGPAARIMPRHRSTPAKDWLVPEAIKQLPFLPSIESAYDQGYRRMVFTANYIDAKTLIKYGKEVLFIGGSYASEAAEAYISAGRTCSREEDDELLALIIALASITPVPTVNGTMAVTDLFIGSMAPIPSSKMKNDEWVTFIQDNRVLQIEEQLDELLDSGQVTTAALKEALTRNRTLKKFLSRRESA